MKKVKILSSAVLFLILSTHFSCSQNKKLKDHILFYSSFDGKFSADFAIGDARIYTAESYKKAAEAEPGLKDSRVVLAKGLGISGDAIHFKEARKPAIFYKAYKNVGYKSESWSGTISFWLRLDPDKDLAPHYCDPVCVTDTKWSDAGLWVDFTDHKPRRFRYGAMGDLDVWDPNDDSDESDWTKRTVTVDPSPFQSKTWTHVAMVFSKVNTSKPIFELYIDGINKGVIENVDDPYTWEAEKGKIMLGQGYIGLLDELAIFDKALNPDEVNSIYQQKTGLKTLFN